jgi:dethiobiotin synthetase
MATKNIFILGTGTEVGKTFVAAVLLKTFRHCGIDAGYFKAAASGRGQTVCRGQTGYQGNEEQLTDIEFVKRFAQLADPVAEMCPYVYAAPLSPHLAARLENQPPEMATIIGAYEKIAARHECMVIEGSGGAVCPLRYDLDADGHGAAAGKKIMLLDVVKKLQANVLVVSGAQLGAINAAVLTLAYLRCEKIPVVGVIVNRYHGGVMEEDNVRMIAALSGAAVRGGTAIWATLGEISDLPMDAVTFVPPPNAAQLRALLA